MQVNSCIRAIGWVWVGSSVVTLYSSCKGQFHPRDCECDSPPPHLPTRTHPKWFSIKFGLFNYLCCSATSVSILTNFSVDFGHKDHR